MAVNLGDDADTTGAIYGHNWQAPSMVTTGRRHLCPLFPRIEQDQSFTTNNQIAMCRAEAEKDGVVIDEAHIYQDHHISGLSDDRPAFNQMLEHIWSGYFPDYLYKKMLPVCLGRDWKLHG